MEGLNMKITNPWVLTIEALLHMKQVDALYILELIKSRPDMSDDLDRNARELLSIRILEDLYAREVRNRNSNVPPPGSLINICPSYSCEDVVSNILQLESPLYPRFNVAHILELDVPSFILQKRSTIQNCFLHQMKKGILEGSNPILKKLKDRSGLIVPDGDSGIPVEVGVSNDMADKGGVSGNTKPKKKLASFTAEVEILEENVPVENENLSLSKNCEVASPKPCGTSEESPKKRKRDLLIFPIERRKFSASFCQLEQLGNSSSRTVEHVDELLNWETRPEIQSMEESRGKEDRHVDASSRLKANNNVGPTVDLQCQQQVPYVNSTPEKNSVEGDALVNYSDNSSGGNECTLEPPPVSENVSGGNVETNISTEANDTVCPNFQNNVDQAMSQDNVHGDFFEISSDSDEHHDLRNDIAMMKNSFLSSQGMDTQESYGTQLNSCVKCNKDGNLLVCSSNSCPLVVHQECLDSAADFDRMENFYCPICAYSQAISRYQEASKKFSLRRADLRDFYVFFPDLDEKSSIKRFHGSKQHGSSEIQNINKHIEPTNNRDSLNKDMRSLQVGEASKSGPIVETPCGKNEKSLRRNPEIISGKEMHNQMSKEKELLCQSDSDTTCASQYPDPNAKKSSDAESEKSNTSKYCIRPRKQGRQIMEPKIQVRRKVLPWTDVEEQTLKEGVRRFSNEDDKTIPWTQIWEFGADVFQQRRKPMDLKDKWRNICKGTPRSK